MIGAFKLNTIGKFTVTAAAEVIRKKNGVLANGNAQVDTAQSKFSGASLLLDGTGDYLSTADTIVTFGTGDFTIEGWVRGSTTMANNGIFHLSPTGFSTSGTAVNRGLAFAFYNTSGFGWVQYGGNADWGAGVGTAHSANTWYHFAMVRSGTTLTTYLNGTSQLSVTDSTNYTAHKLIIGGYYSSSFLMNGWVDEFRISKSARYTANFTPSTTPFVNDSNTVLLLHMDGTDASTYFEDDNGVRDKKGITAIGSGKVSTAQSKFGGASALFDGAGDYLTIPSSSDFAFGSSDFTLECWIRRSVSSEQHNILDFRTTNTQDAPVVYIQTNNVLTYYVNGANRITGTSISTNTWHHVALSRSGTSTKLFLNGTQVGSTWTDNTNYIQSPLVIGSRFDGTTGNFNGYIDEIRVTKGLARYTANFTAPTASFVNDSNTSLLMHCDGTNSTTTFIDDNGTGRSAIGVTAIGNAQVDTAQSKFGGASALFDGTGDRLSVTSNGNFGFSGDFTYETWIKFNSTSSQGIIFDTRTISDGNVVKPVLYWFNGSGGVGPGLRFYVNGADRITYAWTPGTSWHHIAISRSGSSTKMFINGTQVGSTYTDTNSYVDSNLQIGDYSGGGFGLNGWLDEVRISNSARYTANFTAPTAPFQNDSNTVLLLHMDGTDASTVFVDDNGTTPS